MSSATLIYFADIFCPWCYSFAPNLRKLTAAYPDMPVKVVGGSHISRPTTLLQLALQDPGLGQFLRSVQHTSGRSVAGLLHDLAIQKNIRLDSIGADALFLSLAQLAPGHEVEQFTGLEDMVFAQGLDIFTRDSIDALAGQYGIAASELASLASSPAMRQRALEEMSAVEQMLGDEASYPSLFVMRDGKGEFVTQGYVHYETVESRMASVLRELRLEPLVDDGRLTRHRR